MVIHRGKGRGEPILAQILTVCDSYRNDMAKRDPAKTARNKEIDELTAEVKRLLPAALQETGLLDILQLNAKYGAKFAEYIDMQNEVISSSDIFISLYLLGFKEAAENSPGSAHARNFEVLRNSPTLKKLLFPFLRRVYLRNYDALSKVRPKVEDAAIWIGQNNADYGILVTPRFNVRTNEWENDRSEIRHFDQAYWSIGHILKTGLVIPGRNDRMTFKDVPEYLNFFKNVLIRNSGSKYERGIAELYCDYVLQAKNPLSVPLLIPEFRYEGQAADHKYRLDFTIITTPDLDKFGFELSPWSTHGYLAKIKGLTQAVINKMAQDNFEHEMRRHKDFFLKHGIFVFIYTDTDLTNLPRVFEDMERHLTPRTHAAQLRFDLIQDILG
jgi:hypothetical protein